MDEREERLELLADRMEAVQACRNLMGKYSYYHTAFRNRDYLQLWAHRDDCRLVMPFGCYDGYDGVYRCYVEFHGDRSDPDFEQYAKGLMMIHQMNTEVIQVAADGKTARGCWYSTGHETAPDPGKEKGCWSWGAYQVEFIREDGVWKFWKLTLFPVLLQPIDRSWAEPLVELTGMHAIDAVPADRPLDRPMYFYGPEACYPEDAPEPPEPYGSCPGI